MEFLKEILGEELFNQVSEKINAHNGIKENKEKQIKLANLGGGDYVGVGKYNSLMEQLTGKQTELDTANSLIAELKQSTAGNEELQNKITAYDTQVQQLQAALNDVKIKSAIKVALLSEKAVDTDIDYLAYQLDKKLKEKNETLLLDENDNIKHWSDYASDLKTQFPTHFESSSTKIFDEHKLEQSETKDVLSRADILKMSYAQRNQLQNENPEAYSAAMNNK